MPPLRDWLRNAWDELWIEIPQVWLWLLLCIVFAWTLFHLAPLSDTARWFAAVPLGVVFYVLTWGRPNS